MNKYDDREKQIVMMDGKQRRVQLAANSWLFEWGLFRSSSYFV